MRYAIMSDVHANAAALRSVLADAQDAGADMIYCLGDVLGYGPEPAAALQLVHDRVHVCLMGNHDAAACGVFPVEDFIGAAADVIAKHRSMLPKNALAWVKTLPYICEGRGFACAHGDFSRPENFNYIIEPKDALPSWRARTEPLLFVGHTHRPGVFLLREDGTPECMGPVDFTVDDGIRRIVNVGSVGYPRSGKCRSFYCIYDDEKRSVSFRSLPFDITGYREKMKSLGLGEASWIASRAAERDRRKVRAEADFEKTAPAPSKSLRLSTAISHAPVPAPAPAPPAAGRNLAVVLGALFIAFAGVFCTMRLIREIPDREDVKRLEKMKVESAAAPEPAQTAFEVDRPIPLHGGWTAYLEDGSRQKVRVELNKNTNRTAFRIENDGEASVRFTHRRRLIERPPRMIVNVELLTTTRPGVKSDFSFSAKLEFFRDDGKPCGIPETWSGKVSAKNKEFAVPAGAENAVFTLDCRSSGSHDLAVPQISDRPQQPAKPRPAVKPQQSAKPRRTAKSQHSAKSQKRKSAK